MAGWEKNKDRIWPSSNMGNSPHDSPSNETICRDWTLRNIRNNGGWSGRQVQEVPQKMNKTEKEFDSLIDFKFDFEIKFPKIITFVDRVFTKIKRYGRR